MLGHSTTTATQWTPRVNYPVRFQQDEEGNPLVIVQDSKPLLSNTYIGHFHPKKKKKKNTKQARNWGKKSDFFPSNLKSQPPSHLAISVRHDFHLHLLSIVHLLKMPFFWSEWFVLLCPMPPATSDIYLKRKLILRRVESPRGNSNCHKQGLNLSPWPLSQYYSIQDLSWHSVLLRVLTR